MSLLNKIFDHKVSALDVGLTKIAVFAFTLLIAKSWTPILSLEWYWYLLVFILAIIRPLIHFFRSVQS